MILPQFYVDNIIKTALSEDINYIDVTTDYLIAEDAVSEASFVAKAEGTLAGIDVAMRVFELLDPSIKREVFIHDGEQVSKGDVIAKLNGSTRFILKGERTALNLLQHMSGIATAAHKCVMLCGDSKAAVTDTRKTLPGMRALQKYAVTAGGGKNHRFNLSDGAMIKDNHIDAYGGIIPAVTALREKIGHMVKIEVEVRNKDELMQAIESGADVIMLDNMSCAEMAECVKLTDGRAKLEASGNITLDNIADVAATGVDIISLGALTHSVKAFDISLRITG